MSIPSTKLSSIQQSYENAMQSDDGTSIPRRQIASKKVEDLEVKDAQLIFQAVWHELEQEMGAENLKFPAEIFWLNGAPGAGKGTQTAFIMEFRDLTEKPIIVSELLKSPEARKKIDAGLLAGDREVTRLVLGTLLSPEYESGAIVDGYPRTKTQVECLKLFHNRLSELRSKYLGTFQETQFPKPRFHIIMLFIDEDESVADSYFEVSDPLLIMLRWRLRVSEISGKYAKLIWMKMQLICVTRHLRNQLMTPLLI